MALPINIEIISRETIKPCFPTPKDQQNFMLSSIDQAAPNVYVSFISFYFSDISQHSAHRQALKTSLSKVLTRFHPFAGKIKDHEMIECNDDGVEYAEAQINFNLNEILTSPNIEQLRLFFPNNPEVASNSLLQVQVNLFACGGIAIAIYLSHKISDALTLATFFKAWSNEASGYGEVVVPQYTASSIFPPRSDSLATTISPSNDILVRCRYVFNSSAISKLRNIASSISVPNPSRLEVVTAIIWKCLARLDSVPFCTHMLNIRKRLSPPLVDYTIGNLVGLIAAKASDKEMEMKYLVSQLRDAIQGFKAVEGNKHIENMLSVYKEIHGHVPALNVVRFSGWCKLPFYEADFGWGKPTWVATISPMSTSLFTLIDTKEGDGIEVWVSLPEDTANMLHLDQEFLSFAFVNPSVIYP